MRELALHLLDIAENSISALAKNIQIEVIEDETSDRLRMSVTDDGKGMDAETVKRVIDPFVTSRTERKVGLGIPLLKAAAEACDGWLTIESTPGKGTRLEVEFQRSHIDRMPLGDLAGTFITVLIGSPEVHWTFRYTCNGKDFFFDDAPIKDVLHGVPMTEPDILAYLRSIIVEGIESVQYRDNALMTTR